jgi:hypothetical protein
MLHEYHVVYSVRYYPRFNITAVGLGMYYQWIRGHYYIYVMSHFRRSAFVEACLCILSKSAKSVCVRHFVATLRFTKILYRNSFECFFAK